MLTTAVLLHFFKSKVALFLLNSKLLELNLKVKDSFFDSLLTLISCVFTLNVLLLRMLLLLDSIHLIF